MRIKNEYRSSQHRSDKYDRTDFILVENPEAIPSKKIIEVANKIQNFLDKLERPYRSGISIDSLIEGVRMNGRKRKSGLSELLYRATGYREGLKTDILELRKLQPVAQRVVDILTESFKICPDCKGKCGEELGPNWWEDCDNCDGYGMMER